MRYLDLTPEMLGPDRSRLILARIEGWMLWPGMHQGNDRQDQFAAAEGRARYEAAVAVQTAAGADAHFTITAGEVVELVRHAEASSALARVQDLARAPFLEGVTAGLIALEVLRGATAGVPINLSRAKRMAATVMKGKKPAIVTPKTIDNRIWKLYRPVAHLWVSYLVRRASGGLFPCRLTEVETFLAESEEYRRIGESLKSDSKAPPLFDAAEMVGVPENIELPDIEIRWQPSTAAS
jgi:hypothetical protein